MKLKKLDIYQIENDLDWNCNLRDRGIYIYQLNRMKTREEQQEHIEYLKEINEIKEEE